MEFTGGIRINDILICSLGFLLVKWMISRRVYRGGKGQLSLPPCPPGYPLVGNLPMVRRDMREVFRRLANEFGGIFALQIGPRMMVVISDLDAVKEAFVTNGEAFSDRFMPPLLEYALGTKGSFAFDNGRVWKARRRFGLSALRNFGMGKRSMEHRITEEAKILCETIENNKAVSFDPKGLITNAVSNVICSISFGYRFDYKDPVFKVLVLKMHQAISSITFFSIGNFAPVLLHTPLYNDIRNVIYSIKSLVQGVVSEHRRTLDDQDIRDIIDLYILEIRRQKADQDEIVFDEARAWRGIFDLFAAGTGTTSATLLWAILLMAKYPDAMKKVQEEIDRVVGDHRSPSMSDQDAMPMTMATIMEVQRFRPVTPFGIPRFTNQDAQVGGYHVPQRTAVFMNIWELLHSPKYWDEPEKFNPSRFLSDDKKSVVKPEAFIPFGIGHRMCMGELLARMELFLFFSNLMQRFTFRLVEKSRDVPLDGRPGVSLVPHDFIISVESR